MSDERKIVSSNQHEDPRWEEINAKIGKAVTGDDLSDKEIDALLDGVPTQPLTEEELRKLIQRIWGGIESKIHPERSN
jgi:hypothetical protein